MELMITRTDIADRSRVSCAHYSSSASVVTRDLEI